MKISRNQRSLAGYEDGSRLDTHVYTIYIPTRKEDMIIYHKNQTPVHRPIIMAMVLGNLHRYVSQNLSVLASLPHNSSLRRASATPAWIELFSLLNKEYMHGAFLDEALDRLKSLCIISREL